MDGASGKVYVDQFMLITSSQWCLLVVDGGVYVLTIAYEQQYRMNTVSLM
eukprot:m.189743 g.189743  ORF g.189743 m.189743 type:complete len:50 (-) comp32386_c0_seq2:114-263(-)